MLFYRLDSFFNCKLDCFMNNNLDAHSLKIGSYLQISLVPDLDCIIKDTITHRLVYIHHQKHTKVPFIWFMLPTDLSTNLRRKVDY